MSKVKFSEIPVGGIFIGDYNDLLMKIEQNYSMTEDNAISLLDGLLMGDYRRQNLEYEVLEDNHPLVLLITEFKE